MVIGCKLHYESSLVKWLEFVWLNSFVFCVWMSFSKGRLLQVRSRTSIRSKPSRSHWRRRRCWRWRWMGITHPLVFFCFFLFSCLWVFSMAPEGLLKSHMLKSHMLKTVRLNWRTENRDEIPFSCLVWTDDLVWVTSLGLLRALLAMWIYFLKCYISHLCILTLC